MSVLPCAKETWVPSKEFIAAVRDCYINNQPIDLTKITAEDWTQAVAYSEKTEKLRSSQLNKKYVADFMCDMSIFFGTKIDIESLCSFGNLSFVLLSCNSEKPDCLQELNSAVAFIIENQIPMNEMMGQDFASIDFQSILEFFTYNYFEVWEKGDSIDAGAILVSLCDYLGVRVEPLAKSPREWNVPEHEFPEYAKENKQTLKKFARLFSKPMSEWYPREPLPQWWD
jgi:hypothetical protein